MWRWVTRGLVLTLLTALCASTLHAQQVIGALDYPDPAAVQSGMVLVKGWVLAPNAVTRIELFVDDQFRHRLNQDLPRIDVVETHPDWPGIQSARPGFQTGFTASLYSNGPHTVEVRIYTSDGKMTPLGRRTVNVDNSINQSPFGSVDIPDLGATYNASGAFPVLGWAVDTDGIARVDVLMDETVMQSAIYSDARPDVGNSFPDLPAAQFSGFIANVETTRIQDGVHQLAVRAVDRFGVSKEIGRRTVQVFNSNENLRPFGYVDEPKRDATLFGTLCDGGDGGFSPPIRPNAYITPVRGWALDLGTRTDIGHVSYAELLVDGVKYLSTDNCGFLFGGFANCYGMPRYDVQRYYPTYFDAPRAGFLFTLDVGALINLGVRQGPHVLKVRVGDQQQTFSDLPTRDGIPVFFKCSETVNEVPVRGFIDIPVSFDYVSGNVVFQGWAFKDNASILGVDIIIDGLFIGQAQIGFPRTDVQQQYPHVFTSLLSGWRFTMDTTKLSNSRHRVTARAVDLNGNRNEVASVDFYVQNNSIP